MMKEAKLNHTVGMESIAQTETWETLLTNHLKSRTPSTQRPNLILLFPVLAIQAFVTVYILFILNRKIKVTRVKTDSDEFFS